MRTVVATVLAAMSLALGCSGDLDEATIGEALLAVIVLQPDDLPSDFVQFDEGRQAIADAPAGDRADPQRFGRRDGWKARYRRSDGGSSRGPLVVESRADLFDSSQGAGREFDAHRHELEQQTGGLMGSELIEVDGLGDEALALSPGPSDDAGVVFHTVVWRTGNVTASIAANGLGGRFSVEEAVDLARAQQRRIAAATP